MISCALMITCNNEQSTQSNISRVHSNDVHSKGHVKRRTSCFPLNIQ